MKITSVRAQAIQIPRCHTLTTSYGSEDKAVTILVSIDTDEGVSGYGQASVDAPFYGESAEGMLANIRAHLAPALIGKDPLATTARLRDLHKALPQHYFSLAAVDLALWDLKGKALGVPVYQLLGGKIREGVSLMGFVHHDTPERMADEADRILNAQPFPVLKMKIGLDPQADLRRYCAVAEAVMGRAVIQVDGNIGYTLHQAIPTLSAMERFGALGAIEQPVERLHDMAILARKLNTPLMADEAIYPPKDAIDVIRHDAASIALMKLGKHGGIHAVHQIGMIFEAAGLSLSIAIYYDLIAVAATHLAAALPCVSWPSPATDLADTILAQPLEVHGLVMRAPDRPGLGVELDWDKVAAYTVEL